jgi:hypothetical protein
MSRDPDKEYLSGCLLSGGASLVVLAIPIVICLARGSENHDINTNSGLARMFMIAVALSCSFTVPVVRLFGIATAFGALGGFACGTAFWFLHLQQAIVKALAQTGSPTEYLDSTMFVVPIAWLTIGTVASLLPLYKNKHLKPVDS